MGSSQSTDKKPLVRMLPSQYDLLVSAEAKQSLREDIDFILDQNFLIRSPNGEYTLYLPTRRIIEVDDKVYYISMLDILEDDPEFYTLLGNKLQKYISYPFIIDITETFSWFPFILTATEDRKNNFVKNYSYCIDKEKTIIGTYTLKIKQVFNASQ